MFSRKRRHIRLTAELIARHCHGGVIALDPGAIGAVVSLAESAPTRPTAVNGVAVIDIQGPLMQRGQYGLCGVVDGYDLITERLNAALSDPEVGAVVLRVDSPGGDVAGLEEAVRRISAVRDDTGKPVYAYIDEQAASAAFFIVAAVATAGITLPASGLVGSIGTLSGLVDETAALEAEGIKVTLIRDPEGKAAAHPLSPVTEVAEARITERVQGSTARFIAAMSAARGVEATELRKLNGAQLQGAKAVEAGLADRVGSFEDVLAAAAEAAAGVIAMKTEVQALRAALKLDAAISDTAVLAAAAAALKPDRLQLAADVMTLSGHSTPAEAYGAVSAWKVESDRVQAERAKQEPIERDALCAQLVAECGFKPFQVWADPVEATDKSKRQPAEAYADMALPQLRAFVATMAKDPLAITTKTEADEDTPEAEAELTPEEHAWCERRGLDKGRFAASKARMNAKGGEA